MKQVHLGISTCPNDTFIFHGILERRVNLRGFEFDVELLDVEELNRRLFTGDFDVAKASFHAALFLAGEMGVLSVGSALGFGVGPLLLAARPGTHPRHPIPSTVGSRVARVVCPGRHTTATLLYELFHSGEGAVDQVLFSEIMPALERGNADFGVCIHEGRFTWMNRGLSLVEDLGKAWERSTLTPLPLGGILARRGLNFEIIRTVSEIISDSLAYAITHREDTLSTMRHYAQELTDDVLFKHVDLYVNKWTADLGDEGRAALELLGRRAYEIGMLPSAMPPLAVF